MRLRTLLVAFLLLSIVAFVVINWSAITAPTKLSLLVTSVEAPIGLVMLGIMLVSLLVFGAYALFWQGAMLVESRRQAKELQAQRLLADQAEASRFTELNGVLQTELTRLGERIAQMHEALGAEMRENANSVAATIGELDDRMQRRQG
jgi:uncharacterized integral membrane protein